MCGQKSIAAAWRLKHCKLGFASSMSDKASAVVAVGRLEVGHHPGRGEARGGGGQGGGRGGARKGDMGAEGVRREGVRREAV